MTNESYEKIGYNKYNKEQAGRDIKKAMTAIFKSGTEAENITFLILLFILTYLMVYALMIQTFEVSVDFEADGNMTFSEPFNVTITHIKGSGYVKMPFYRAAINRVI